MNLNLTTPKASFFQKLKNKNKETQTEHPQKITKQEMQEDMRILKTLDKIKLDLEAAHQYFDEATDETLIDVYIYELKALNMKFKYYHEICKERGLIR